MPLDYGVLLYLLFPFLMVLSLSLPMHRTLQVILVPLLPYVSPRTLFLSFYSALLKMMMLLILSMSQIPFLLVLLNLLVLFVLWQRIHLVLQLPHYLLPLIILEIGSLLEIWFPLRKVVLPSLHLSLIWLVMLLNILLLYLRILLLL